MARRKKKRSRIEELLTPREYATQLQQEMDIANGTLTEQRNWADPERVAHKIAEQEEVIRKAHEQIQRYKELHAEAPNKIEIILEKKKRLQKKINEHKNRNKIDRVESLVDRIAELRRQLLDAGHDPDEIMGRVKD